MLCYWYVQGLRCRTLEFPCYKLTYCRQKSRSWIDTFVPRQPLRCNKSADNKLPSSGSPFQCDNWNRIGIYERTAFLQQAISKRRMQFCYCPWNLKSHLKSQILYKWYKNWKMFYQENNIYVKIKNDNKFKRIKTK